MNDDIENAILKLLAKEDVRWTWYRLERALSQLGLGQGVNIAKLTSELEKRGFLEVLAGDNPSMPVYVLTDLGKLNTSL